MVLEKKSKKMPFSLEKFRLKKYHKKKKKKKMNYTWVIFCARLIHMGPIISWNTLAKPSC